MRPTNSLDVLVVPIGNPYRMIPAAPRFPGSSPHQVRLPEHAAEAEVLDDAESGVSLRLSRWPEERDSLHYSPISVQSYESNHIFDWRADKDEGT